MVVGHEGCSLVDVKLSNGSYQRCHVEQTKLRFVDTVDTTEEVPQEVHDSSSVETKPSDNVALPVQQH